MITLLQWPPQNSATFSVRGRVFTWDGDEPFITLTKTGAVNTDPKELAPGFINRIQRYGRQNGFSEEEWQLEKIYFNVLQKIPKTLRGKYFKNIESSSQNVSEPIPNTKAPVPSGFALAAKLDGVADDDPDLPLTLARLKPDEWLALLKRWVSVSEDREGKTVAGPAWWYALHTVAKNPYNGTTPLHFVGLWVGNFPCRICRINARRWIGKHPVPDWKEFDQWADTLHSHVTASKK